MKISIASHLALLLLASTAFAGEFEDLLPRDGSLDAEWAYYREQGIPGDKPAVPSKFWEWDPEEGVLRNKNNSYGILLHNSSHKDFELEVEFRYVVNEGQEKANSGIFVRQLPDRFLMHQIELATGAGARVHGGQVTPEGELVMLNTHQWMGKWVNKGVHMPGRWRKAVTNKAGKQVFPAPDEKPSFQPEQKPLGEWNKLRAVCEGDKITIYLNGQITCVVHNAQAPEGMVGIESEGTVIEVRTFRIREL